MFGRSKKYVRNADGVLLGWFQCYRKLNGRIVVRGHYRTDLSSYALVQSIIYELEQLEKTDN